MTAYAAIIGSTLRCPVCGGAVHPDRYFQFGSVQHVRCAATMTSEMVTTIVIQQQVTL